MVTLTAYSCETGLPVNTINISVGSANAARRVPAAFARWYLANERTVYLHAGVSRGPTGRTIVRKGRNHYTRVSE